MKSFEDIQRILNDVSKVDLSNIKKIYLLGSTGAGKTSLVKHIIDTASYEFPSTTQTRTTVSPTEYVIKTDIPFKTIIIPKDKEDIEDSIISVIYDAIQKALENFKLNKDNIDDIIVRLEESTDERFRLKYMVSSEVLKEQAWKICNNIIPLVSSMEIENETLFADTNVQYEINNILKVFFEDIEECFNKLNILNYELFSGKPIVLENFSDKKSFIERNKELLKNEFGSLSLLVEYVRIEGNLLADWLPKKTEIVLIDGEGIGHSLREKRDTLSVRHYNFFDYCNQILLVEKADDPFISGGQGAIETIFLNGYKEKFKLIFSKMDTIAVTDKNSFLRKRLTNLDDALKKQKIIFGLQNADTFKVEKLDQKTILESTKKEISKLYQSIINSQEAEPAPLEYDFSSFFSVLDTKQFINNFRKDIDEEHWMTIKAFSNRMYKHHPEFKGIKPVTRILTFIMEYINEFLQREDQLHSDIAISQNKIKQLVSRRLLIFIYHELILSKDYLWQQVWEESGKGSHQKRKDFMFKHIFQAFLPNQNDDNFESFRQTIKTFLVDSGAKEMASASKIILKKVDIIKAHQQNNFNWTLGEDVNILIGKNGTGKSTILKLIHACINREDNTFDKFLNPYVDLTILKYYDKNEQSSSSMQVTRSKIAKDVRSILIDFNNDDANEKLQELINQFSIYYNGVKTTYLKNTEIQRSKISEIEKNISSATVETLQEFQKLRIEENLIKDKQYKPLLKFKTIIDSFYKETNKEIIFDDIIINNPKIPFLIKFLNIPPLVSADEIDTLNFIHNLSSGEKQILIIFLTILVESNKPYILLMDEPEISLHVEWQSILIDSIKKLDPNIQIIIATHNPLLLLNRKSDEIGIINFGDESVHTDTKGTKYLDISSILLDYFKLSSLIGIDMQKDIKEFTQLKLKEDSLAEAELSRFNELQKLLANNFAGDIIYNSKYFTFLKYLQEHKDINFDKYEKIDNQEMESFLKDFEEFFK